MLMECRKLILFKNIFKNHFYTKIESLISGISWLLVGYMGGLEPIGIQKVTLEHPPMNMISRILGMK